MSEVLRTRNSSDFTIVFTDISKVLNDIGLLVFAAITTTVFLGSKKTIPSTMNESSSILGRFFYKKTYTNVGFFFL
jgi:hypothetical protein